MFCKVKIQIEEVGILKSQVYQLFLKEVEIVSMFVKEPRELFRDILVYYRDSLGNTLSLLLILLVELHKPTPHLFSYLCQMFVQPVIL